MKIDQHRQGQRSMAHRILALLEVEQRRAYRRARQSLSSSMAGSAEVNYRSGIVEGIRRMKRAVKAIRDER